MERPEPITAKYCLCISFKPLRFLMFSGGGIDKQHRAVMG